MGLKYSSPSESETKIGFSEFPRTILEGTGEVAREEGGTLLGLKSDLKSSVSDVREGGLF